MDKKLILVLVIIGLIFAAPVNAAIRACDACNSTCNTLPGMNGTNGTDGINGINGTNGTSATITINFTGTLPPGSPADVDNIGDSMNAIFDFWIPKGDKGDKGDTGDPGAPGAANMTMNQTMNQTPGLTGGYSILYSFSTTTTAPPADGFIRYNSGTPVSVTAIYIEETERGGEDVSAFLSSIRVGTRIKVFKENSAILFHLYNITTVTDSGNYYTLAVSEHSGSTSNFANNDNIAVGFALMGAQGSSAGSGDTTQFLFLNGTRVMTGGLQMGGFNISNLADPVAAQEAATKNYVDIVNTSMRNNVSAYVIAVNNSQTANTSAYVIAVNNSMKAYVDALPAGGDTTQFLFLNGTRAMTGIFNMSNFNISKVLDPVSAQDAATKNYVDLVNTSMRNNVSAYVIAVNDSMRNNVSANFASVSFVNTVNDTMRNNVSQYVIAVNNTQTLNMSLINATQNVNVSLVNTSMRNNVSAYVIAVNDSMRNNVSVNHAALVSGKVPTAQLGSGSASGTTYLRGDQTWATPGGSPAGSVFNYYTIPFMALTNSPADNAINYIGNRPIAPSTTANTNKIFIPTSGVIERFEAYDYSGTAGTAETYGYYFMHNGATEYWINNLTVATNERVFSNSTVRVNVAAGDYLEVKRKHPAWATNPLTNIVGGYFLINQTASSSAGGYALPVQALTSSPTDGQTVYFGNMPKAPTTTAATSKIYVPKAGNINRVEVYVYSGTAGTAEVWTMNVGVNGSYSLVTTVNNALNERIFRNATLNVPVSVGNYIEIQGVQPTWGTNPATTIYGGYVWIGTA